MLPCPFDRASVRNVGGILQEPFKSRFAGLMQSHIVETIVKTIEAVHLASLELSVKSLADSQDRKLEIIEPTKLQFLQRVAHHPGLCLPIYGPNSSGKSAFNNTLLEDDWTISATGTTTGRAAIFSYAPLSEACIEIRELDDLKSFGYSKTALKTIDISKLKQVDEAKTLFRNEIARPEAKDLAGWLKHYVHVKFPFNNLRCGLSLVDLPGTAKTDSKEVESYLFRVMNALNPMALVLLHKEIRVGADTTYCVAKLKACLPENCRVFHLCNFTNIFDFTSGGRLYPMDWVAHFHNFPDNLMSASKNRWSDNLRPIGSNYLEYFNCARVNVLKTEFQLLSTSNDLSQNNDGNSDNGDQYQFAANTDESVWQEFLIRFSRWILATQAEQFQLALNYIQEICVGFDNLADCFNRRVIGREIKDQFSRAFDVLSKFQHNVCLTVLSLTAQTIKSNLKNLCNNAELLAKADAAAATIGNAPLESKPSDTNTHKMTEPTDGIDQESAFIRSMSDFFHTEIVAPASLDIISILDYGIDKNTSELVGEFNNVLKTMLAQSLIDSPFKVSDRMSETLKRPIHQGLFSTIASYFSPSNMFSFSKSSPFSPLPSPSPSNQLVWRQKVVRKYLQHLASLPIESINETVYEAIDGFIDRIRQELEKRLCMAQLDMESVHLAKPKIYVLRYKFLQLSSIAYALIQDLDAWTPANIIKEPLPKLTNSNYWTSKLSLHEKEKYSLYPFCSSPNSLTIMTKQFPPFQISKIRDMKSQLSYYDEVDVSTNPNFKIRMAMLTLPDQQSPGSTNAIPVLVRSIRNTNSETIIKFFAEIHISSVWNSRKMKETNQKYKEGDEIGMFVSASHVIIPDHLDPTTWRIIYHHCDGSLNDLYFGKGAEENANFIKSLYLAYSSPPASVLSKIQALDTNSLPCNLRIAHQCSRIVRSLHESGIVHGAITMDSFAFSMNPTTGSRQIMLYPFGIRYTSQTMLDKAAVENSTTHNRSLDASWRLPFIPTGPNSSLTMSYFMNPTPTTSMDRGNLSEQGKTLIRSGSFRSTTNSFASLVESSNFLSLSPESAQQLTQLNTILEKGGPLPSEHVQSDDIFAIGTLISILLNNLPSWKKFKDPNPASAKIRNNFQKYLSLCLLAYRDSRPTASALYQTIDEFLTQYKHVE